MSEIIDKGFGVIYGSAQNSFSEVEKEHFSYSGETEKMDALLTVDLLVIDDLGTEFLSSFTQSAFYNIINTRILHISISVVNYRILLTNIISLIIIKILNYLNTSIIIWSSN